MAKSKGHSGSPRHTATVGPGPKGAEEQDRRGPGSSMQTRSRGDASMFGSQDAASGKQSVQNHTRGREEDGN